MSRYYNNSSNGGCLFLFSIVGIIAVAIQDFTFFLKFIGVLIIVFILYKLMVFFKDNDDTKINIIESNNAPILLNKNNYNISSQKLTGSINSNFFPEELLEIVNIETIDLRCKNPIDISEFINNNKNLNTIKLFGPFYLKNQINKECKISNVTLVANTKIYEFLIKSNEFLNLTYLSIQSHNIELNLVDKLNNFINLKSIHIVAKIKKCPTFYNCPNLRSIQLSVNDITIFPYEYLHLENLTSLALSNNKISSISKSTLSRISNTNLEFLYLDSNLLNRIPFEIFKFKSLKKISISYNPVSTSHLKKLSKQYDHIISIDSDQKAKMEKSYFPQLKRFAIIILYLIIITIPYICFNHGGISFLFFLLIVYGLSNGILKI